MLNTQNLNHNLIAKEICQERDVLFSGNSFYQYVKGVYLEIGEYELKRVIMDKLGEEHFSKRQAEEIMHSIKTFKYSRSENLNWAELLNVKNGMLNPNHFTLEEHDTIYNSMVQLPVNFNPDAKCPLWEKTLSEIFIDQPENIGILQEFFGLCLTKDTSHKKALFLLGEANNGKSKMLEVLQSILGKSNWSAVSLEQIQFPTYTSNLCGKLANISIETNTKSSVYDSVFKAITSGDPITVKKLYHDPFEAQIYCKMIFALNNMPHVDDKTNAFFDRLIVIKLNRSFSEKEQNKKLIDQLKLELDGIFLWMLTGLKRLNERGRFDLTETIGCEVDNYRRENNNVMTFIEEECILDTSLKISKKDFYENYSAWSKSSGHRALGKNKFGIEILKRYKEKISDCHDGINRLWIGVGIAPR